MSLLLFLFYISYQNTQYLSFFLYIHTYIYNPFFLYGINRKVGGITFDNFTEGEFSVLDSWLMMIFDSFLYIFLAWYFSQVFPGDFGIPKPFYFVVQPSFWMGKRGRGNRKKGGNDEPEESETDSLLQRFGNDGKIPNNNS